MAKKHIGATLSLKDNGFFATLKKAKSETALLGSALGKTGKEQAKFVMEITKVSKSLYETTREQEQFINKTVKASKTLRTFKNDATKAFKKVGKAALTGLGVATGAISAFTVASTDAFADYEQYKGGIETLFGAGGKTIEEYASSVGSTVSEARSQYDLLMSAQNEVMENAQNAYRTAGLSANEYMNTTISFSASLINSLGGDTKKAASYANTAIIDMSDNVNKMGTTMESVQNAYTGFAKGNFTMLDNLALGYGGTKEEMQRLLNDASEISGISYDISSFADMVQAIHVIQEKMDITGTTAREASSTIQGSFNSMKAAWTNVLTAATSGEGLESAIDGLVTSATNYITNMMPAITQALSGIGRIIRELAPVVAAELPNLIATILPDVISALRTLAGAVISQIPTLFAGAVGAVKEAFGPIGLIIPGLWGVKNGIDKVTGTVNKIKEVKGAFDTVKTGLSAIKQHSSETVSAFGKVKQMIDTVRNSTVLLTAKTTLHTIATKLQTAAQTALNAVTSMNPVTLIISVIVALIAVFAVLWYRCEGFRNFFINMWQGIKNIATVVGQGIKNGFSAAVNFCKTRISAIGTAFVNIKTKIGNVVGKIKDTIVNKFKSAVEKVKSFFKSIPEGLKNIWSKIREYIKVPKIVKKGTIKLGDLNTPIPKLGLEWNATGGIMTRPTAFAYANGKVQMGGEAGSEAILPLKPFWDNLQNWTAKAVGQTAGALQTAGTYNSSVLPTVEKTNVQNTSNNQNSTVNTYKKSKTLSPTFNVDLDVNITNTDNRSGNDLADEVIDALVPRLKRIYGLMV